MTMSVIFEHPLNELVRGLLRIEKIFSELDRVLRFSEDKNIALMLMSVIIRLLERPDLKSKLTNSLHQQYLQLQGYANNPQIEQEKLSQMLVRIDSKLKLLKRHHSFNALMPSSHVLIKKYQAEMMSHGATALIADPLFYAWEQLSEASSLQLLNEWRVELDKLYSIIQLALELTRQSQPFKMVECNSNFYSQSINFDYNLIRLRLPAGIIPEFSAGRHHVALRFKRIEITNSITKASDADLDKFDIAYCI